MELSLSLCFVAGEHDVKFSSSNIVTIEMFVLNYHCVRCENRGGISCHNHGISTCGSKDLGPRRYTSRKKWDLYPSHYVRIRVWIEFYLECYLESYPKFMCWILVKILFESSAGSLNLCWTWRDQDMDQRRLLAQLCSLGVDWSSSIESNEAGAHLVLSRCLSGGAEPV